MLFNHIVILYNRFIGLHKITLLIVITTITQCTLYTKSACIIIHGTWAKNTFWYRPSGDFFEAVEQCNKELQQVDEVISFSWSGKLGYPAQLQAAKDLVDLISLYDSIIIIAHSHGSTVGMMASSIIGESISNSVNFFKIKKFYSLGVPVQLSVVKPNMDVIYKFYNLFSFGDLVQTVNGVCERVFFQHSRIFNVEIVISGKSPGHSQLHDVLVGKYLLWIDDYCKQYGIGKFQYFCDKPGKISFFKDQFPLYELQENFEEMLKIDKQAHILSTLAFFRSDKLLKDRCQFVDYQV